jgi:hypothetical protein
MPKYATEEEFKLDNAAADAATPKKVDFNEWVAKAKQGEEMWEDATIEGKQYRIRTIKKKAGAGPDLQMTVFRRKRWGGWEMV